MSEIDAAAVNRRERWWARGVIALLVVLAGLLVTVALLAAAVADVDESERESRCLSSLNVRLFAATIRTLNVPIDERDEIVARLVSQAEHLDEALRANEDPCEITVPEVFE